MRSAPFALALVPLFFIDLEHHLLPDVITLCGTAAGLLVSPWNPELSWTASLAGASLGYGILWALRRVRLPPASAGTCSP